MARIIDSSGGIQSRELIVNSTLKNTYLLLAMTLAFSALMAGVSMAMNLPYFGILPFFIGAIGLSILTTKYANSSLGLVFVFAFTGFLGAYIGPILNSYITNISNGSQLVLTAMGGTAGIFFALSAYVLTTRKDFSFMGGMLAAGFIVAIVLMVTSFFVNMPVLHLAVSGLFMLLSSGLILYQTSEIIHGGETNYIRATVTLFTSLFNIFISLLNILGIMGDD